MALAALVSFQKQRQKRKSGFRGSWVECHAVTRSRSFCKWLYCLDILIKKYKRQVKSKAEKDKKNGRIFLILRIHPEYSFYVAICAPVAL